MQSTLRSLGGEEAKVVLEMTARGEHVVTPAAIGRMVGDMGRARGVIRRLLAKGWLHRAKGGHYVLLPPAWGAEKVEDFDVHVLASASVDKGYVGWWSAAGRHGFTTQVPNIIHVATDRQAASREIQGTPVRYVKLAPRKLFGWQDMPSFGRAFRISTPEKTIVDCADRPDLCGGLIELAAIVARGTAYVSDDGLAETAARHGTVSTCQRLGYLLDLTVPDFLSDGARSRLRSAIPSKARSIMGREVRGSDDVGFVPDWGLVVNARETDLLAEVPATGPRP